MKEVQLTRGKVALVDDEDFESVSRFCWRFDGRGYAITSKFLGRIGGKQQMAGMSLHRLIMRPPKGLDVDHINHDGLDCRRVNMRVCTRSQNHQNRAKTRGTSKFKGVSWHKGAWRATIVLDHKQINLGLFDNEAEAGMAYDAKARELFGEFAHLNFPEEVLCVS